MYSRHVTLSLFKVQHTFQRHNIAYLCWKCCQTQINQSILKTLFSYAKMFEDTLLPIGPNASLGLRSPKIVYNHSLWCQVAVLGAIHWYHLYCLVTEARVCEHLDAVHTCHHSGWELMILWPSDCKSSPLNCYAVALQNFPSCLYCNPQNILNCTTCHWLVPKGCSTVYV